MREDDAFLASAQAALRSSAGDEGLEALGWADFLETLDSDRDGRRAVLGLFRAQGRTLGSTSALGRLMAEPYRALTGIPAGCVLAVEYDSPRRGPVYLLTRTPEPSCPILVHRTGVGLVLVGSDRVALEPVARADSAGWVRLAVDFDEMSVPVPSGSVELRTAAAASRVLGRVAVAAEILGAAETALDSAVGYASERHQFGAPIGSFQAIRHLLAAARVDCAAVEAVLDQAIELYPRLPEGDDAVLKALAGRNGRRVCGRTLQVLGGIGFTVEHDHHRFHSRVLALDALLGSSAQLAAQLAADLRRSGGATPDLRAVGPVTA